MEELSAGTIPHVSLLHIGIEDVFVKPFHLPWPFWFQGKFFPFFFFNSSKCQKNGPTTRKTWGTKKNTWHSRGKLLKLQLHNLKSLRFFFFEISNFSKLKKFRAPFFCSSTNTSTAQNWPRVGPKQMAAWEKYFNSFKPRFPRLWWHKLFP